METFFFFRNVHFSDRRSEMEKYLCRTDSAESSEHFSHQVSEKIKMFFSDEQIEKFCWSTMPGRTITSERSTVKKTVKRLVL